MQPRVACDRAASHHLRFFESDLALANGAAEFLAAGLSARGRAVVIVTPDHREPLLAALRSGGLDPDALQADSRLIVRDANDVLSACSVSGTLDAGRLEEIVTATLDALAPGTAAVQVYTELGALLRARGHEGAIFACEDRWHGIASETALDVLSAYPADASSGVASGPPSARARERYASPAGDLGPRAYRAMYTNSPDGVLFTDPNGDVLAANPAACEILRRSEEEICALGRAGLTDPTDLRWAGLVSERRRAGRVQGIGRMLRGDGTPVEVETSSRIFTDVDGTTRTCTIIRDVTERVRLEAELVRLTERLRELAVTDDLTGLYNRRGFLTVGERVIDLGERQQTQVSVLFLDIDDMKQLNDRYGHPAGDAALKAVADALRHALRRADSLARIGGDEFVALALDLDGPDCAAIAARIEEHLARPETIGSVGQPVEVSIGWTTLQPGEVNRIEDLIDLADRAMYRTKDNKPHRGSSSAGVPFQSG